MLEAAVCMCMSVHSQQGKVGKKKASSVVFATIYAVSSRTVACAAMCPLDEMPSVHFIHHFALHFSHQSITSLTVTIGFLSSFFFLNPPMTLR